MLDPTGWSLQKGAGPVFAAGIFKLERTSSDLENQTCDLIPAEIDSMWKTAPSPPET